MIIDWPALRSAATDVAGRAYAPYSRLRVGAAGLTADGRMVTGCNVENASFGLTLCAECGLVSALHATALHATTGAPPASCCSRPAARRCSWTRRPARCRSATCCPPPSPPPTCPPAAMPDAVSLIKLKRDNVRPLTEAEIGWLFAAYAAGEVADEQMAALLMAIFFNGLTVAELRAWTGEMIASGDRLPPSGPA